MKKIILSVAFVFASFAMVNANSNVEIINNIDSIDIAFSTVDSSQNELLSFAATNLISLEIESAFEDFPCRWRYCSTRDGVKTCSEWNYGECLEEVQL